MVTMFVIMAVTCYPVLILLYVMFSAQAKPKGGLLFGARLLEYLAREKAVQSIVGKFRRRMKLVGWVTALVPLTFLPIPYVSVQMTLWIVWLFAMIGALCLPFVLANREIRQWKVETGETTRREKIIYAELRTGLRTLRFTSFLPGVILSAGGVAMTVLAGGELELVITAVVFGLMTPLFGLCALWMDRQRLTVISSDSDVNMNYNRAIRGQWKSFWLWGAWFNTAFTLGLGLVVCFGNYENTLTFLMGGALIYTGLLIGLAVLLMVKKSRLDLRYRDKMELTGYLDDDENWRLGMFYYNPGDPRVGVEKRFGVGTTTNMATPGGKAVSVLLLLIVVGSLMMCGRMMLEEFTPLRLEIQGECLVAEQLGEEYSIPLAKIDQVALVEGHPEWSRVNGTSMTNLRKGTFRLRETGERVEVFLNPENTRCIMLTADGTTYYLSCASDEDTILLYHRLNP